MTLCYVGTQLIPQRGTGPNFWPLFIVAKRSPISATADHLLLTRKRFLNIKPTVERRCVWQRRRQSVACLSLFETIAHLKPNSITLAGSKMVRSWFEAGSKLVRAEIWPRSSLLATNYNELAGSRPNSIPTKFCIVIKTTKRPS